MVSTGLLTDISSSVMRNCKTAIIAAEKTALIDFEAAGLRYSPSTIGGDVIKKLPSKKCCMESVNAKRTKLDIKVSELFRQIFDGSFKSPNRIEPLKSEFKGLKQAREYGKERAIEAINKAEPYEHMVIIDKSSNKVLGEYKGVADSCWMQNSELSRLPKTLSIEHGHPTECVINGKKATTPVSWEDFKMINKKGEDIIAFDVNGKFSMLAKKPNFKQLTREEIEHYEYLCRCYMYPEEKYLPKMLKHLPEEFQNIKTYKEFKLIFREIQESGKLTDDLKKALKLASEEQKVIGEEQLYAVDRFWRDFADELGVIYKTNYEWLTKCAK